MLKKVVAIVLLAALLCAALPAAAATLKYATTGLNVRSGPGTKYEIVGVLKKGESVSVTGRKGSWAKLSYNGGVAYAFNKYLEAKKPETAPAQDAANPNPNSSASTYVINKKEKMTVTSFTGLYEEAKIKAHVAGWLEAGETVVVTGSSGSYWKSVVYNNKPYFVKARDLAPISYRREGCVKACTSYGCDSHCKCDLCLSAKGESFYKRAGFFQVIREDTPLYPGAAVSFAPIQKLDDVKTYKYTGYSANWVRVDLGGDDVGYVQWELVTLLTK